MGSVNLTADEMTMRYPQSILQWEQKHGIARYEKNGIVYVCSTRTMESLCESILNEKVKRETQERLRKRGDES